MRGSSMVIFVPEIVSVPAALGSLATIRSGLNQVAAANPRTRSTTRIGIAIRSRRTWRLWRLAMRNACERSERLDAVQPSLRSAAVAVVRRFAPSMQARNQARRSYAAAPAEQNGQGMWPRRGTRLSLGCGSRMRENVLRGPAGEIQPRPIGQEPEAGRGELGPALAREQNVELVFERVLVRIGPRQPRRDLGAIERGRHDAERAIERRDVEAGEMEDLQHGRIGQEPLEIGRVTAGRRDLHDVGAAVARRELDDTEPVAVRIEPHGLGVDRDRAAIARQVGQIPAVQPYGHVALYT